MKIGKWIARLAASGAGAAGDAERIAALLQRAAECQGVGDVLGAEECYRQALSLQPEHAGAGHQLAHLLALRAHACQERGEFDAAVEGYEESLALDPGRAQVRNNLGNVYQSLGRLDDAAAADRVAIAADARLAEAHFGLAVVLEKTGEAGEAIAHCRAALALRPNFAEASLGLGFLLEQEGDAQGALERYREAIAARPDYAEARFNYGLQLLLRGDYEAGWKEYEWRMRLPGLEGAWPPAGGATWDGSPLEGRVILLYGEQGFGDVLQFVRYAPLVAERGGAVILRCQPKLKALLSTVPGVSAVLGTGEPLPPFDVSCSLLSLPRVFGTTLETIPAPPSYVRPDPEKARHWKARLAADGASLKVGLFWATETKSRLSSLKSLTLDMLAPLGGVPRVTYYSLQRGAAAGQAAYPPQGMAIVDLSKELADFSDDAALMSHLDLIISVDTATAHLAGAMGRRVWTLTHFPPEWRWLLGRDDSPWYPTMRLFRRGQADTWEQVILRIGQAVRQLA